MRDDPDFNIDLVQEIEKFPCLYDLTHVDYTKRNVQDRVWRELAEKMGEPVDAIKSRWKNLRSRHFKVKNHSMSGAVKRKSYYLAEYLQFLDKVGEHRQAEDTFYDVHDVLRVEVDDATDDVKRAVESHAALGMYRDNSQMSHNTAPNDSETSEDDLVHDAGDRKPAKNRVPQLYNGSSHVKPSGSQTNVVSLQDPDLAFMYSLVPDVRNMNDNVKRKFRIKVLQLIDETLSNQQ